MRVARALPARETLVGFRVREAPEPRAGSRQPLASAFIAAAASLRADVHRICKPLGDADGDDDGGGFEAAKGECVDWLGLTATGAKPGTPAAAALAGALVAIEAHKLAAVKASRLRDEEERCTASSRAKRRAAAVSSHVRQSRGLERVVSATCAGGR